MICGKKIRKWPTAPTKYTNSILSALTLQLSTNSVCYLQNTFDREISSFLGDPRSRRRVIAPEHNPFLNCFLKKKFEMCRQGNQVFLLWPFTSHILLFIAIIRHIKKNFMRNRMEWWKYHWRPWIVKRIKIDHGTSNWNGMPIQTPLLQYLISCMATYMVLFRSMDVQKSTDGQVIQRIKGCVAREKSSAGNLANQRRTNMHRLLAEEQAKVKK